MHTYRKADGRGWQAGYHDADGFTPVGPAFVDQCWAAAYASFLNGGRFSPGEIELLFGVDRSPDEEDDDSTYPDRPKSFDNDYPLEATQRHK